MVLLLCFLGVPQARAAWAQCGEVRILAPQPHTIIAERRPAIEWTPAQGALSYRLSIQSRIPEGRVVATIDTRTTETRFLPPQPLAEWKSLVTVQIHPQCEKATEDTSESSQTFQFAIDTSPTCVLVDDLKTDVGEGAVVLTWRPVLDAVSYEVSVFAADDGKLLVRQDAHTTQLVLSNIQEELVVVGVRPSCRTGAGEGIYRVVPLSVRR